MNNQISDNELIITHIRAAINKSLKEGYDDFDDGERSIDKILEDAIQILTDEYHYNNVSYDTEVRADEVMDGDRYLDIENGVMKITLNDQEFYFGYWQKCTTGDCSIYSYTQIYDILTKNEYFKPAAVCSFKFCNFTIEVMEDGKATIQNELTEKTFSSVEMALNAILKNASNEQVIEKEKSGSVVFTFMHNDHEISVYENNYASIVFEGKIRKFISPAKAIYYIDKNS